MTTWFVSRHPGALEWIKKSGIHIDKYETHLDFSKINPNDVVIGILPVNIIAKLCSLGAKFYCIDVVLPANKRGVELSSSDMDSFDCHLRRYVVQEIVDSGDIYVR